MDERYMNWIDHAIVSAMDWWMNDERQMPEDNGAASLWAIRESVKALGLEIAERGLVDGSDYDQRHVADYGHHKIDAALKRLCALGVLQIAVGDDGDWERPLFRLPSDTVTQVERFLGTSAHFVPHLPLDVMDEVMPDLLFTAAAALKCDDENSAGGDGLAEFGDVADSKGGIDD